MFGELGGDQMDSKNNNLDILKCLQRRHNSLLQQLSWVACGLRILRKQEGVVQSYRLGLQSVADYLVTSNQYPAYQNARPYLRSKPPRRQQPQLPRIVAEQELAVSRW